MGNAKARESIVINVSREDFRKVLVDYEKYPEFVTELSRVTVDDHHDNEYTVSYFVSLLGKEITYTLRLTHEPPGTTRWALVRGDFMKVNRGSWELEELGPNQIHAHYEIEIGAGMLVPSKVLQKLQENQLPKMLKQFKARAESLYG